MEIGDQTKVDTVLSGLQERYAAMHAMRQRVENVCLWVLGVFVVVAGWIVQGNVELSVPQKGFLCGALLATVIGVRCRYLADVEKGFTEQLRVAARLEKALGFYEPGYFDPSEMGVYPEEWSRAGTESGKGRYFEMSYLLLYIGTGILIVAIVLQSWVL